MKNKSEPRNKAIMRVIVSSQSNECSSMIKILGLEPSQIWEKGDLRAGTIIKHKDHSLVYQLEKKDFDEDTQNCLDVPSILDKFLDDMLVISDKIRLIADAEVTVSCILYFTDTPCLNLSTEIFDKIKELSARELDIDLYPQN